MWITLLSVSPTIHRTLSWSEGSFFKGTWDNVMILKNVFVSLAPEKEENLQLYFPAGKNCDRNCLKHWKNIKIREA